MRQSLFSELVRF